MTKKTLEEMLKDGVVKPGISDSRKRLATFLSYWEEIEDAYKKGWSWLDIYNALFQEGIVDYSYSTFLHYKDRKYRRELEAGRHEARTRKIEDAKGASTDRPAITPGSTKIDMPVFGEKMRQRATKRF